MLEFCPMCRSILQLKEEKGVRIGFCNCGFKRTAGISIAGEEKTLNDSKIIGSGFVDEKNSFMGGEIQRTCKKCGCNRSEVSNIEGAEASIFIYKCLECGFADRESTGGSKV